MAYRRVSVTDLRPTYMTKFVQIVKKICRRIYLSTDVHTDGRTYIETGSEKMTSLIITAILCTSDVKPTCT